MNNRVEVKTVVTIAEMVTCASERDLVNLLLHNAGLDPTEYKHEEDILATIEVKTLPALIRYKDEEYKVSVESSSISNCFSERDIVRLLMSLTPKLKTVKDSEIDFDHACYEIEDAELEVIIGLPKE